MSPFLKLSKIFLRNYFSKQKHLLPIFLKKNCSRSFKIFPKIGLSQWALIKLQITACIRVVLRTLSIAQNEDFSKTSLRLRAVHYSRKNSILGDWQGSEYATVPTLDDIKSNLAHCFLQTVHTALHPLLNGIFNFAIYWFYNEEPEKCPNRRK